jgi:hypothetical protein
MICGFSLEAAIIAKIAIVIKIVVVLVPSLLIKKIEIYLVGYGVERLKHGETLI